jgi:hypothetical protein
MAGGAAQDAMHRRAAVRPPSPIPHPCLPAPRGRAPPPAVVLKKAEHDKGRRSRAGSP